MEGGEKETKKGKREGKQTREKKKKSDREINERKTKEGDFSGIPTVEAQRSEKKS